MDPWWYGIWRRSSGETLLGGGEGRKGETRIVSSSRYEEKLGEGMPGIAEKKPRQLQVNASCDELLASLEEGRD